MRRRMGCTLAAVVLVVSSCAPARIHSYLRPHSQDPAAKVHQMDCCGTLGPHEIVAIDGPHGSMYLLVMRRVGKALEGRVGLYAPRDVRVEVDSVRVIVRDEGGRERMAEIVGARIIHHEGSPMWGRPCANIGMERGGPAPDGVPDAFVATGRSGSRVVMAVRIPEAPADTFHVRVPPVRVNGESFAPAPVEFRRARGGWVIYPMNC